MSRMVAWGSTVLLAVIAMYVDYEVYTGWTAAEKPGHDVKTSDGDVDDSVNTEYAEGSLSDAELEDELDQLLDDHRERSAREASELDKEV